MTRSVLAPLVALFTSAIVVACVVKEEPPPSSPQPAQPQPTAGPQPTYAPQPTTATPQPTAAPQPTTAPTMAGPTPTAAPMPTFPTMPGTGGMPAPGSGTGATPGAPAGLVLPGVCIPIGSWTKKFDNGLPSTGTVSIATPVIFNQFPVSDGVVVAGMPAGTLKGNGAMTSTNDLSVDVTNGAITVSYTCKFGSDCKQGSCTVTKGGLGGFKLVKQ